VARRRFSRMPLAFQEIVLEHAVIGFKSSASQAPMKAVARAGSGRSGTVAVPARIVAWFVR